MTIEIFTDTSALYALLDRNDRVHRSAAIAFDRIDRETSELITTSYVVLETVSLVHARLGSAAVRDWRDTFEPLLTIEWISRDLHDRGMVALTSAAKRQVSLTDWTSFEFMRSRRIAKAFAFDPHFREQGFELLS